MAVGDTHLNSDGKSVQVDLTATVAKGKVIVVDEWIGIANGAGDSGEAITMSVDPREWQLTVPAALNPAVGDIIYIDITDLTGHYPDESAYYLATGSDRVPFMKVTRADDSNNVVTGILLSVAGL